MRYLHLLALAASVLVRPLAAQVAPESSRLGGITLDQFGVWGDGGTLVPTFRMTNLPTGRIGSDLAVGLFAELLAARVLAFEFQAGPAYPIRLDRVTLVLKAGVGGIASLGGSAYLVPGYQAGIAALVPVDRKSKARVDLVRHSYSVDGDFVTVWSVGLGFSFPMRS